MSKNLLLIFTRNPELGKVKTRLAKSIGNDKALKVYIELLNQTKRFTENLPCDKIVYYSENINCKDIWDLHTYRKELQSGNDLGNRMANAFKQGFSEAYDKIIIIGSDLYDLTSDIILEAFERLDSNDVVLGPATDGGYYLLGMKELIPSIFRNKEWGTASVFSSTLKDIADKKVFLTKELNDIDVVTDMENHPVLNSFL